jgi:ribose/xylose/arabinose/galactoside ABC-type transport system permease subunit
VKKTRKARFENLGLALILVALIAAFWIAYPRFLAAVNVINILLTVSVIGILAVPWSMLCISGGLDISIGSMMGFYAVTVVSLFVKLGLGLAASIAVGFAVAALVGLVNGLLITKAGIGSIITTLGMYSVLRGAAFVITGGQGVVSADRAFKFIGLGRIGMLPFSVVLLILFFLAGYVLLNYTQFGRNLYVVGGNERAARVTGIDVDAVRIGLYIVTAMCAGFGGLIIASQLANAMPKIGTGYEFAVITAVVLGGVSLGGGRGTLYGVLFGILIIGTLRYGLEITGVHSFYQTIAEGAILLAAVALDQVRRP